VSPTAPSLHHLLAHRFVFVGGKGGVGKTTIAAALSIAVADRGRRCLLVSTDPAHSVGDVFDVPIGNEETLLAERLWGLEIDPEREADQHIASVKLQLKSLVHPRMYDAVERQIDLARSAPGTLEAALLERMAELMAEDGHRFDIVVFDTAPTGHTLHLLSLPEIMMSWTEGLLKHRERSSKFSSMLRGFGKGREEGDEPARGDAASEDEQDRRAAKINAILRARQQKLRVARDLLLDTTATAFYLVLNPDRLSILETEKALAALSRVHVTVSGLVVNRVLPKEAGGAFLAARRRREAPYLEEIESKFKGLPRATLPLWPDDVHGLNAIREISTALVAQD
jgi:arsenite-transporting ATPase